MLEKNTAYLLHLSLMFYGQTKNERKDTLKLLTTSRKKLKAIWLLLKTKLVVIKVNKQLIIPIVALVVLVAKQGFGYEMPDETTNLITDAVLAIITLAGIFMHPKGK